MSLHNEPGTNKPDPDAAETLDAVVLLPAKRKGPVLITPAEFFRGIADNHPGGVQGLVFLGANGQPCDHLLNTRGVDHGPWAAEKAKDRKPAYMTMAAFKPGEVSRFKGRAVANVVALRGFWVAIEGSSEKFNKPGGEAGGYADAKSVMLAVAAFGRAVPGLVPNYLVLTGSGGVHLHYVLSEPISAAEWLPRAKTLVVLAATHGFKIDAQCTTDAARIMRAPGSLHQKTGVEVLAYRWKDEPYTQEDWDRVTGHEPGTDTAPDVSALRPGRKYDLSVNGDVLPPHKEFSYLRAAEKCGAMRKAADRNGQDTPYPVWVLALRTAALSIEGREFAHEISCRHADYDKAGTDEKLDSLTGGPPGCDAWGTAYGAGGPCDSCELRGKIKNPAVQLGTVVDVTPPGSVAVLEPDAVAEWVVELNHRFALVRHGSKLVIVDFHTPSMTGRGVVLGLGFLDVAAFRQMLNGRFPPVAKPNEKPRALADAWLAHPGRRQYAGLVYAPGEALPSDILNLWQGFAVAPVVGDVTLWLEVLAALVPKESERVYVLRWLAWKIQNPGGVPDTLLIFKGAKGTGKNSLFDPLILLFGRHAMLADDPELIAGRFTWHLMTLSFAVLDEAVFIQDPRQADRIKSRVTAKTMQYEQKGMDPVQGVNRCAYVMLTNHEYVWQATNDERRAVVLEVGEALRGNLEFWGRYHAWAEGPGPAALLHYLQGVNLTGFNPRQIPKGEALRKQVEQTALRVPATAWWHQCLTEGAIRYRDGMDRVIYLNDGGETEVDRAALRMSYEQSAAGRTRSHTEWPTVARKLSEWAGPDGVRKVRARVGIVREWRDAFPPLPVLRAAFTAATSVQLFD
ncbi:DUF5906 domain-containing protein [Polaromonas sp.]|uniref:primase-helicase family protein n=1 Tax=Polaromonas sp. TaxID=1869339 RepID=UPI0013BC949B|nr:DUF5906 domain-containing protein [Polaromonas sp.]NDP64634.1 hypothetical protein [Polaromonas sp.]